MPKETRDIVIILVKNSKGQLFVNKRREDRKLFPGYYGLGAGGRIEKGEKHSQAAVRELFEETGLKTKVNFLFKYKFEEYGSTQFIYETVSESNIPNADKEWQWSGWMDKKDVDKILEEEKFAPDTAITYRKYCEYLKEK